ncbi:2'-5' RNA ligase [Lentibacillus persicus]|uniref:RNA 2',3'-cyclic phosphodiesterase n=1 Tax=Lentibacillus persicus TaxID=640948 RepID=A0A1I1TTV0_9BACI|nr:RNA 2',3'-cyclic phosphodiesterase [Lentibacillus persicus]SFD61954.1 2'-5' RNA ligase [Lentibacillus persicus]
MNSPHYFIAVPLPSSLKEKLAGWQRALKPELPFKQWVHPEDLHITLKFLGAVSEEQLNMLIRLMAQIRNFNSFSLMTGGLGTFGNPENPRVLWTGVERKPELMDLQQYVEGIAFESGFKQEKRPYSPHITLAKKSAGKTDRIPEVKSRYTGHQPIAVNQVVLFRIHPGKKPKYGIEEAYKFSRGREQ